MNDPLGAHGTVAWRISGTNIVGLYWDGSGNGHGFLYNGRVWTRLDDPLGGMGTTAQGISGANIVGGYYASDDMGHGFLATPIPQLATAFSGNSSDSFLAVLEQCPDRLDLAAELGFNHDQLDAGSDQRHFQ